MGEEGDMKGGRSKIDPVSVVKNWRTRVKHEQGSADQWQQDWGFLAAGAGNLESEDALKIYTIDDKIRLVEEQLKKCTRNGQFYTTSTDYGNKENLGIDKMVSKKCNRNTDKGLMACTRKFNAKLYGKRGKPK